MSVYRVVWAGCAIVLILTGGTLALLALTPGLVVVAISVSLLSAGLVGMIAGSHERPTLRGQLPIAAAAFTMMIVGAGLTDVAGPIGPATMVLMVALSPTALRWLSGLRRPQDVTTSSLASMTDQELFSRWRRSSVALAGAARPADHHAVVEARAAYLDELERRDAVGFACWVAGGGGAADDPAQYLGKHPS